jgi:hypothetical protein
MKIFDFSWLVLLYLDHKIENPYLEATRWSMEIFDFIWIPSLYPDHNIENS